MKKTATVPKEATVDVICDICNESVVPDSYRELQQDLSDFQGFGVLKASFGYGSTRDGQKVNFDLCETCFQDLEKHVEKLRASNLNR